MRSGDFLRRLGVVFVLILALAVLPAASALADDGGADQAEETSLVVEVVNWLVSVVSEAAEGDGGAQIDPMG